MASEQRARAPKKERTTNPLADDLMDSTKENTVLSVTSPLSSSLVETPSKLNLKNIRPLTQAYESPKTPTQLGIFNIPDLDVMDDDNESGIDESALESGLEAILSGKVVSKPPRPKKKAKKRKCAADDKSTAKRNNAPDPMPNVQRRQFGDDKLRNVGNCWICHKFADDFYCPDCPRVYHNDCLRKLKSNTDEPLCKCKWTSVDGLNSHNTNITSDISELLRLALYEVMKEKKNKKLQTEASEYMKLLDVCPEEYKKDSVREIWNIKFLIDKIHHFSYENTGNFFQDVKWIHHNSYITFGPDHEMTTTALKFEKAMKQQLSDMEACGECYREKCAQIPQDDFFSKVCSNPHPIVWAKLRGFPFWPAKCLRIVNRRADVRFFGTHDKSLIPLAQVFKISRQNPGGNPKKPKNSSRTTSYHKAMAELRLYIENFEKKCGVFQYFNEKTLLEPVKKSGKRMRPNKNGSQLEVSMDVDALSKPVPEPSDALPPTVTTRGSSSSIAISSVTKESCNDLTSSPLDPSLLKSPPSLPASAATSSPLTTALSKPVPEPSDALPPTVTTRGSSSSIAISSVTKESCNDLTSSPLDPSLLKSPPSLPASAATSSPLTTALSKPVPEPSDALPPTVTTRGSSSSIAISSVTKESCNDLTSSPLDPSLLKSPPSLPASAATSSPLTNYEDDAIENFVRSVNQDMVKKMKSFIEYLTQDEEEEEGDEEGETFEIDNYAKEKCRQLVYVLKYLIDFASVAHN